jgi:hypothetical protein
MIDPVKDGLPPVSACILAVVRSRHRGDEEIRLATTVEEGIDAKWLYDAR